jgi:serine/threonine protein kinase
MSAHVRNADSIFAQAIDMPSAAERAAFLEVACGTDAEMRREVEKLVRDHFRAGAFMEAPAVALLATVDEPVTERPGTIIGPYKLMEQIGEGGMGLVFVAEQQEPVRRKVALKVIKPGMDTRQVIARFEAERQALALMDHPNIAQVHDGGQTASGRPYFVMELVKGVPITDYCDQNRLTPRQRLELFLAVCQAVQHAHHKGIIHRDIKPSNVLVVSHDGKAVVKVIDFGVAKAIGQQLTDKTVYTQFAQLIGTPLYMSPEQAGQSGLDVDTRSDIYALGVLLYELLTGTTPFSERRFKEAGFDEMRRLIREEEPPRPSTRISTLGQAAATVSTNRNSDPKHLSRLFRGELDWIVMKALEKDRECRYESANAFAADVQRYLNDEPVLACPPSAWYRFRKLARRRKGAFVTMLAAVLVVLLGVTGLAVSNVLITREKNDKQNALNEKEKALEQVRKEKDHAERNLARAEANFQETLGAVDQMLSAMSEDAKKQRERRNLNSPEDKSRHEVRWSLMAIQREKARQIFQQLADRDPTNPDTRLERAWAYQRLARIGAGDRKRSVEAYDKAIALLEQLAAESPDTPNRRRELAETYSSFALMLRGQGGQAVPPFRVARSKAIALYEGLAADFPNDPQYRLALAEQYGILVYESAAGAPKAEARQRALAVCTKLAQDFPGNRECRVRLVGAWRSVAMAFPFRGGQPRLSVEGEESFRQAMQLGKKLVDDFNVPRDALDLAHDYWTLGKYLEFHQRAAEAETSYRQALALYDKLPPDAKPYGLRQASKLGTQLGFAELCSSLGDLLRRAGRTQEAEQVFRRSVDFYEQLSAEAREFDARDFVVNQVGGMNTLEALSAYRPLGELLRNAGRLLEAEQVYRKAIALDEKVWDVGRIFASRSGSEPEPWDWGSLAADQARLCNVLEAAGQPDRAEEVYRKTIALCQLVPKYYPFREDLVRGARVQLVETCTALAKLLKGAGHPEKAELAGRQAVDAYRQAVDGFHKELDKASAWGLFFSVTPPPGPLRPEILQAVAVQGLAASAAGRLTFPQSAATALMVARVNFWAGRLYGHVGRELADAGHELGSLLFELDKKADAAEVFRMVLAIDSRAIAIDPRLAESCNNRAWPLATDAEPKRRDGRLAVTFAQLAVRAAPTNGLYWNTLGAAQYRAGNWKEAAAALEKSMEFRQGGDGFDWFFLAMAHWQLGDKELACKWYAPAVLWMEKYAPGDGELRRFRDEAAALLGMTAKGLRQQSSGDEDLEIWTLVLEAQPDSVAARCQRADAHAARGEWARAAADYARAFEAQGPANPFHWFQQALIRLQLGDVKGYRQICGRMWKRFGSSNGVDYFVLAHACALAPGALGEGRRTRQLAEQRLALTPPPSLHHVWSVHVLGLAYCRAGQYTEAVACLEKGLKDYPSWDQNVLNWLVLAMAERRLGHAATAKEYLSKANNWIARKDRATPKASGRFAPPDWAWRDWLMVQLFRREAGALIEGQSEKE